MIVINRDLQFLNDVEHLKHYILSEVYTILYATYLRFNF